MVQLLIRLDHQHHSLGLVWAEGLCYMVECFNLFVYICSSYSTPTGTRSALSFRLDALDVPRVAQALR
jgi:hypothetical protein